jgi:hypothetical protein
MAIKSVVFAAGFFVMALYYVDHGVSEIKKAILLKEDGPSECKKTRH